MNFDPSRIEDKCEGRHILANAAGIPLEIAATYFNTATQENFQEVFNKFSNDYPDATIKISNHRNDGVGPGEMVAWFLFDNVTLGGKNSSMDISVDGKPFAEMKAGRITKKTNTLDYFKITKDTDKAVNLILKDLISFNDNYYQITGNNLPGWEKESTIKVTALAEWSNIDLTKLDVCRARKVFIEMDTDGNIFKNGVIEGNVHSSNVANLLLEIAASNMSQLDLSVNTLEKIIDRWKTQAYIDYISNKSFALLDADTIQLKHFGEIPYDSLSLYRVHRNQPWARIFLDKL